ncbi:MAG: hypothetical protein ABEI13_03110 [Candidatus Paceibacteria bacterium]
MKNSYANQFSLKLSRTVIPITMFFISIVFTFHPISYINRHWLYWYGIRSILSKILVKDYTIFAKLEIFYAH